MQRSRRIIHIVVVLAVCIWLLQVFGIIGPLDRFGSDRRAHWGDMALGLKCSRRRAVEVRNWRSSHGESAA